MPLWPAPEEEEFVRGVGPIVTRRKGGLNNWIGEARICAARKSIRFLKVPTLTISDKQGVRDVPVRPAFRRFYFDGMAIGKYEIGFAFNSKTGFEVKQATLEAFIGELLQCNVEIPIVNHAAEKAFLIHAGKKLAEQYLHATSRLKTSYDEDRSAIKVGKPFIYVDIQPHEHLLADPSAEAIPLQEELTLTPIVRQHQTKTLKIWLSDNKNKDEKLARKFRISALRLDLAVQCLPKLFKEIVKGNIQPSRGSDESERLQYFLMKNEERILGASKDFNEQIIEKAKELYDKVHPGERSVLREKLDQDIDIRKTLFRKMEDYADTITGETEKPVKKIQFVGANPVDTQRIDLMREFSAIQHRIQEGKSRDQIELLLPELAATPDSLQEVLVRNGPHVVHFSGHGQEEGIFLEDETGHARLVPGQALEDLFYLFSDAIECVVLNACFSEAQARAIARHIPYVIGMNREVPNKTATQFAAGFYEAIANGKDIPFAFEIGKNRIQLHNLPGSDLPRLIDAKMPV
jgi:hypothetical protein